MRRFSCALSRESKEVYRAGPPKKKKGKGVGEMLKVDSTPTRHDGVSFRRLNRRFRRPAAGAYFGGTPPTSTGGEGANAAHPDRRGGDVRMRLTKTWRSWVSIPIPPAC
ncbi:hypothetical protein, unlikely [Trypanosoma brucei gambiense DAL972]|uniref:Uncharacterized protein n=1 Tax=Trypanosoma brucei gambiense (strain MHOM/CI/86/DAL972) TaxID=679716 RepID=C9ZU42_TRYB9|nr:hypothetical protein, unlikely [Trypanosoma brucei gambiense DAL972]CBH12928.1 hypothetical protein, unlikely [Trypanosoma brucei gambiense DAL972]|eukprot:XP_011775207.1 hypothetical protein, unlikely [Trypanosoma brucei gambiense DAL972]